DVREQDRDIRGPATTPLCLRERLPCLQCAEAQLAHRARSLRLSLRDEPADALWHLVAGRRQRVPVAVVARQQPPDEPGRRHELRPRVGAANAIAHTALSAPLRLPCGEVRILAHYSASSPISTPGAPPPASRHLGPARAPLACVEARWPPPSHMPSS